MLTLDGIQGDAGAHGTKADKTDFHVVLLESSNVTRIKLERRTFLATGVLSEPEVAIGRKIQGRPK